MTEPQIPLALFADSSPFTEEQFAAAFEFAGVGMALLDTRSKAVRVNRALCQMLGRSSREFARCDPLDIGHPDDVARDAELRALLLAGTFPSYQFEKRFRHKDGRIVWAHQTCTLVRDAAGLPAHFIVQVQDLSERKAMEDQLRESEERFRATFEEAALGIAHIGLDGRVLRANRRLCEMHRRSRDELVGRDARNFMADAGRGAEADLQALLEGRVPSYTAERRFLRGDGSEYPARVSVSLVRSESAGPYLISFIEDISERLADQLRIREQAEMLAGLNSALEERIRERTAQLEQSNEELRTFAYSLAHDLRAPLSAIDGFSAELARRLGEQSDTTSHHYLTRVRAGVKLMSDLTDAMLSLAHLSHAPLLRQSVDLSGVAANWLQGMRERDPARRAQVRIEPTPRAEGDVRLLTAALDNLLANAWKFTSGRDEARIEFGARTDGPGPVVYYVRDNGAGFDPAYADKLFMPFQRLHAASEFPGTGVGLAMVRKIVMRHGGRVWGESREGRGAVFYFTLGETAPLTR